VRVEVLAYAPTFFFHCQHCEVAFGQTSVGEQVRRDQARESLPTDLREEFARLADWVHRLLERHGRRIDVRVIDAASVQGVWKSLRYRTRAYPVAVIEGTDAYAGPELTLAEADIERRVAASG
jgi:hypothetical protein